MTADTWNPEQYDRFRDERSRPFFDLADLVQRQPEMRVLDLGCGSGRLTAWLHRTLGARETLGIDSSAAMLSPSAEQSDETAGLRFLEADIASGVTVLLIEHKMDMLMELCHHVVALNFGEKICEGPPHQVQADTAVIEAYMGSETDDAVAG